ncbi:MAG: phosphate/phosphite/phosphonate ABC transporter substrate-binding protein [Aggregatilineales bacterium]|nr:phosphate/phosphite/phosphonate ABC transporter substrate-binding protein [Aggregatilineales bacterium]HQE18475.1 phosphate/phosphite/phosphonate ABC transporter substrate-binding protein [Aggregatilineales bacterium]
MPNKKRLFLILLALTAAIFVLAACAPQEPAEEPAAEEPAAEEPAEGSDLGTPDNPIVMSFVPSQDSQEVLSGAEEIANRISEITGYAIESNIATEYAGVITAMCNQEAHVGALNTFGYVLANEQGCADVVLTSVRFGASTYAGQIIVRADSGIESIADLAGKTMCRPDPLSTSGWIIPALTLRAEGIDPDTDLGEVVDAGGHDAVVLAVYDGQCDAGATFVDARSNVSDEVPDVMEQVVVIQESAPIPNDTISVIPQMPDEVRENLVAAFLQISEEEPELLNEVYSWEALAEVDDSFYDGFRQQLDASGLDITDLTGN